MYVIQQRFRTHLIPLTPGYQSHNTLPFFSGKLKIKLPLNYLKICVITRCQRKACNRATAQAVSLRNHVLNPKIRQWVSGGQFGTGTDFSPNSSELP